MLHYYGTFTIEEPTLNNVTGVFLKSSVPVGRFVKSLTTLKNILYDGKSFLLLSKATLSYFYLIINLSSTRHYYT